ncbi:MAG: tetratricopeptide repeat protein, partial [Planctomycetota bacterium]
NPDIANAHYDLGFAYREEGNRELAEKEFALYEKLLKQEGEYIEIPEKPITEDKEKFVKPEDTSPKTDTSTGVKTSGKMLGQTEGDKIAQDTLIAEVMSRGLSFYDKGMIDKAIDAFKEILEIYPENSEAYYNLGNAYSDKEMFDEAISMYKKAVENNPGFVDAYLNLSTLYLDMDLIDEAISLCKQAVNTNPDDAFLCFYLGEAYALNLHYKEAITAYNKSISINPMDPEAQYRLAESYYETEQFDMALEHASTQRKLRNWGILATLNLCLI